MPPTQFRLIRSFLYLAVSKGAFVVSAFILYAVLVRLLPREQINIYGLALTYLSVMLLVLDLGFTEVATRTFAKAGGHAGFFRAGVTAKTIAAIVGFLPYVAVTWYFYPDPATRHALMVAYLIAGVRSCSEFVEGILLGLGRPGAVCAFTIVQSTLVVVVSIGTALWVSDNVVILLSAYAAVMALVFLARFTAIARAIETPGGAVAVPVWSWLREGLPFAATQWFFALGVSFPIVIISLLPEVQRELAVFQGAHRINTTFYLIASTLGASLFASLSSALGRNERETVLAHLSRSMHLLFCIGSIFAVVAWFFGDTVTGILFGNKLPGCGTCLRIMALSAPICMLAYIPAAVLPAGHCERAKMVVIFIATAVEWPAIYWSTQVWGLVGCAWATSITLVLQCVMLFAVQWWLVGFMPRFLDLWRIALATCVVGGFYALLQHRAPDLAVMIVGVILFFVILLATGEDEASGMHLRAKVSSWFRICGAVFGAKART